MARPVAFERDDDDELDVAASSTPAPLLLRVLRACMGLLLRPVREMFFLLSWVVWLFSSITLGTGTNTHRQVEEERHRDKSPSDTHRELRTVSSRRRSNLHSFVFV